MVNTNPQVIYNLIWNNIGFIVGKIAKQMLDINHQSMIAAVNATSSLSEDEIKYKIWQTCVKNKIFDKDAANNYQVEQAVLDIWHDCDEDSSKLHSFDLRGSICQMIVLTSKLNDKVNGYNS